MSPITYCSEIFPILYLCILTVSVRPNSYFHGVQNPCREPDSLFCEYIPVPATVQFIFGATVFERRIALGHNTVPIFRECGRHDPSPESAGSGATWQRQVNPVHPCDVLTNRLGVASMLVVPPNNNRAHPRPATAGRRFGREVEREPGMAVRIGWGGYFGAEHERLQFSAALPQVGAMRWSDGPLEGAKSPTSEPE